MSDEKKDERKMDPVKEELFRSTILAINEHKKKKKKSARKLKKIVKAALSSPKAKPKAQAKSKNTAVKKNDSKISISALIKSILTDDIKAAVPAARRGRTAEETKQVPVSIALYDRNHKQAMYFSSALEAAKYFRQAKFMKGAKPKELFNSTGNMKNNKEVVALLKGNKELPNVLINGGTFEIKRNDALRPGLTPHKLDKVKSGLVYLNETSFPSNPFNEPLSKVAFDDDPYNTPSKPGQPPAIDLVSALSEIKAPPAKKSGKSATKSKSSVLSQIENKTLNIGSIPVVTVSFTGGLRVSERTAKSTPFPLGFKEAVLKKLGNELKVKAVESNPADAKINFIVKMPGEKDINQFLMKNAIGTANNVLVSSTLAKGPGTTQKADAGLTGKERQQYGISRELAIISTRDRNAINFSTKKNELNKQFLDSLSGIQPAEIPKAPDFDVSDDDKNSGVDSGSEDYDAENETSTITTQEQLALDVLDDENKSTNPILQGLTAVVNTLTPQK